MIKAEDKDIIDFDDVMERNLESARWNRDNTMVILKCNCNIPSWYINRPVYNHEYIINLIQTYEWTIP